MRRFVGNHWGIPRDEILHRLRAFGRRQSRDNSHRVLKLTVTKLAFPDVSDTSIYPNPDQGLGRIRACISQQTGIVLGHCPHRAYGGKPAFVGYVERGNFIQKREVVPGRTLGEGSPLCIRAGRSRPPAVEPELGQPDSDEVADVEIAEEFPQRPAGGPGRCAAHRPGRHSSLMVLMKRSNFTVELRRARSS